MTLAACTTVPGPTVPGAAPGQQDATETVPVESRDIVSVVALDGTVVANPRFSLIAPHAGRFTTRSASQKVLPAKSVVGWIEQDAERTPVTLPVEAKLVEVAANIGAHVPAGLPLIVFQASGFGLRAQIADAVRYRLLDLPGTARMQIEKGPGPVPCPVLGGPVEEGEGVSVTCAPPGNLRLYPGLKGIMAVDTARATAALALPMEAVAGSAERGRVAVETSPGKFEERDVRLGINDGSFVQILDGLAAGDRVRRQAPILPTSRQR
ncbi:efflux RND transporter periplasmic adaptor subunit [Rhizomonospora bruguierae]|uniref:hypothetical protein n=1 Tax=Rhizomonospora bruguierae TaxID=1581705 RepID=UPI001BCC3C86|nr:hypothetical protein [Micromonospora sp. NBRC 107566]